MEAVGGNGLIVLRHGGVVHGLLENADLSTSCFGVYACEHFFTESHVVVP
jgi:hypothetical protein